MKKFLIAFTLLFIATLLLYDSDTEVVMAPHVEHYVTEISESYPKETLACLDYVEVFNDIYIYNYEIPYTIAADGVGVAGYACSDNQVYFHHHPPHDPPQHVTDYIQEETGRYVESTKQYVYMSKVDIDNAIKFEQPYAIVASDGYYAWWSQEQIARAKYEQELLLEPIQEQKNF